MAGGGRPLASAPVTAPHPDTDVLVVGAGPAGTAAAITLARAGRRVTVIDKATFPRDKCCGDGLTTGALRVLEELGFRPSATPSFRPVDAAWVRSPSGRTVRFGFPEGRGLYGAVVPRVELDASLVDLARAAGATVLEGEALAHAADEGDHVTVTGSSGRTWRAAAVVGADGMWSPLRKALGLATPGYLGEWHAFRQYVTGVTGDGTEKLWVWFEPDLLPGYAWSFPLPGGRANVGFGVLRDGTRRVQDMKHEWADLLERPHVRATLGPDAKLEDRHLAWPIPARVDRTVAGRGRALFVGDAVAATDPLTGEGIGQALLSGVAAGRALAATSSAPEALRRYRDALARELVADHRMSVALGKVLRHGWGARGAVRVAGATDWTRRNFARWLFEDEPRAIALTPGRWHRRFLDRDGAYAAESAVLGHTA